MCMGIAWTQPTIAFRCDGFGSISSPAAFRGKVPQANSKNHIVKIGNEKYFTCLDVHLNYLNKTNLWERSLMMAY